MTKYVLRETEVDLGVHYVRTPAGAKRYHRPIGAPIGVWPDAPSHKVSLKAKVTAPVKSETSAFKVSKAFRSGIDELSDFDKARAVRGLRSALRNDDKNSMLEVSNHDLVRIAAAPTQHADLRAQAKRELAQRVIDAGKIHKLHRQAALRAIKDGETPNHFLSVEGHGLTKFQKALISLNPKYGNAFLDVLQRLKGTSAYRKYAKSKHISRKATVEHLKDTKHTAVHKAINMAALAAGGAIASHLLAGLGMDPSEAVKHLAELFKEAAA